MATNVIPQINVVAYKFAILINKILGCREAREVSYWKRVIFKLDFPLLLTCDFFFKYKKIVTYVEHLTFL